jgi:hypothetical protein
MDGALTLHDLHRINDPSSAASSGTGRDQEKSRRAVATFLLPIALGHEASVVVVVLGGAKALVPATLVRVAAAGVLLVGGVITIFTVKFALL